MVTGFSLNTHWLLGLHAVASVDVLPRKADWAFGRLLWAVNSTYYFFAQLLSQTPGDKNKFTKYTVFR